MKRPLYLIITLLHLSGTVGMPVVAYSCVESGAVGVVSYQSAFTETCYADSCCDEDQDQPNVRIDGGAKCCDLSGNIAPENSRVLLPSHKYEPAKPLPGTLSRFDTSLLGTRIVPTRPSTWMFRPSISSPLLV